MKKEDKEKFEAEFQRLKNYILIKILNMQMESFL